MPQATTPTAIAGMFIADCHFSARPPIARAAEPDWMETQARVINQLSLLQRKYGSPPMFAAGDIVDRWDQPVWFVNWLLHRLRVLGLKTIPGEHDIPSHNYRLLPRSAYWTLVEAGVTEHLTAGMTFEFGNLHITPVGHGQTLPPGPVTHALMIRVAVIHGLCWTDATGYKDAPRDKRVGAWLPALNNYDLAVFGHNHKPFFTKAVKGQCQVWNCGTLMRRKTDEKSLRPRVCLLHTNGSTVPHYLDTNQDKWNETATEVERISEALHLDFSGFVDELAHLRDTGHDFPATARREMERRGLKPEIREIILRAVEEIKTRTKPE